MRAMRNVVLVAGMTAAALLAALPAARAEDAGFMLCEALPHRTCVQNGDLIWLRGRAIRLGDIRAPARYASRCPAESILAWKAALRLRDLLNQADFELIEVSEHTGGHVDEVIRIARRDGISLGRMLMDEGLARPWSAEEPDWCSEN